MKVCQLCAVDFTLKNFLLPLIDAMQSRGWQIVAVCAEGGELNDLRKRGYRIETVPILRSMNPIGALRALVALVRLFSREKFDVLHAHTPVAALIGRLAARLTGIPLVVYTAHGFYFHEGMPEWKYELFLTLERIAGIWTDLLFTQSMEDAQVAIDRKIVSAAHVLAIGNGVDISRFDPRSVKARRTIRAELGIPDDAYVVGFIGRQVREKGIGDFLLAAGYLVNMHSHVWFLLIGERLSSDHDPDVVEEIATANDLLGQRLIRTGLRNDIPEMLNVMDLFCLPSWREGMPRTIIEAMMMEKPVIATDIRGSREEVVHEETGLLVPPHSPQLLAGAICRLVDNPAWGMGLGIAGRARALRLYDESRVIALQLERIALDARIKGIC